MSEREVGDDGIFEQSADRTPDVRCPACGGVVADHLVYSASGDTDWRCLDGFQPEYLDPEIARKLSK